jgi:Flp pilus assembly protein TadD
MKAMVTAGIAAGVAFLAAFLLVTRVPAGSALVLEPEAPGQPASVLTPGWHRRPFGRSVVVYPLTTTIAGQAAIAGAEGPMLRYSLKAAVDPARLPELHAAMHGSLDEYLQTRTAALLGTIASQAPPADLFSDLFREHSAAQARAALEREGFAGVELTVQPLDADGLLHAARSLAPAGEASALRAPLTRAIASDPRDWRLLAALGMVNESEKLIADAESNYLDALALDPGALPPMERLLTIYTTVGEWAKLQRVLDAALAMNPDSVPHLNWTGLVLMKREDFVGAERAMSHALELAPGNTTIMANMGTLLMNTGRNDEAIAMFRRAVDLSPVETRALVNLGSALAASDRYAEALEPLERAEASGSLSHHLASTLAIVHDKLGHAEKATAYRAKAQELKQQERAIPAQAASPPA